MEISAVSLSMHSVGRPWPRSRRACRMTSLGDVAADGDVSVVVTAGEVFGDGAGGVFVARVRLRSFGVVRAASSGTASPRSTGAAIVGNGAGTALVVGDASAGGVTEPIPPAALPADDPDVLLAGGVGSFVAFGFGVSVAFGFGVSPSGRTDVVIDHTAMRMAATSAPTAPASNQGHKGFFAPTSGRS